MSIDIKIFGTLADGRGVKAVTLKNKGGMEAEFLTYGCRIASLRVPGRNGKAENVVLGCDTLAEYEAPGNMFGAFVGRYANRIGSAHFRIRGKDYAAEKNEGENCLHSGATGFQNQIWRLKRSKSDDEAPSVTFAYRSPAGEGGFPGNLDAAVTYTLSTDNALIIEYRAETDAETPLNLTNHSYFNLTGDPTKEILAEELQINADYVTETDDALIPTGKLLPVEGTPFDFRNPKAIGQDIGAADRALQNCGGYDLNYAMGLANNVRKAADLYDGEAGRRMLVFTDLPGIQLYTANSYPAGRKCCGAPAVAHNAVCLETQFYPDSVNRPEFPYKNLGIGKTFRSTTIYKFSVD